MEIKYKFYIVFFNVLLLISCKKETNSEVNSSLNDNKATVSLNDKDEENHIVVNKDSINMRSIFNKFEKNIKLSTNEYRFFCHYIINNNDESLSENTGYLVFQYFLNNKSYCNDFQVYLKTEKDQIKDKVLVVLVQFMCIDLADDKYDYDKLINDFSFFKESRLIKKELEECVSNY